MNKIISTLLIVTTFIFVGCEKSPSNSLNTTNNMEGKWIHENNSLNTMYIFQDGVRYTYYCSGNNCDSLYQTYQAGDGNNLPETNNYTYQNDTCLFCQLSYLRESLKRYERELGSKRESRLSSILKPDFLCLFIM